MGYKTSKDITLSANVVFSGPPFADGTTFNVPVIVGGVQVSIKGLGARLCLCLARRNHT